MEWSRGPTIGCGSTATVSVAASTATFGDLFAVKSAELSRSSLLQKEQHFLSQLSSPHIVQYKGFEITYEFNAPTYNLFMEYIPGGSIADKIKKEGGSLDESTIQLYTRQILMGLDYLHLNGLVHCDIKGENLLLGESGTVKIADLGCAKRAEEDTSAFSGTPAFMAPEVARGEKQGFEADVWALGCTIIEMATGAHPWPDSNSPAAALYRIGFSGDSPEPPAWFSGEAADFLSKCLERDCEERWTAQQLMKHPFLDNLELGHRKSDEFVDDSVCPGQLTRTFTSQQLMKHAFLDNLELGHRKSDEFVDNSVCPGQLTRTFTSPVSVLDQGFWESVEESESQRSLTHAGSSSNSPAERILSLISSNLPNWGCDEEWVTVRDKDIEESSIIVEQNEGELIPTDSYMFSDVGLEDVGDLSTGMNEGLAADMSADAMGGSLDCDYDSADFLLLFGYDEDVIVPVIFELRRKLMEVVLFLQFSSLGCPPSINLLLFVAVSLTLLRVYYFLMVRVFGLIYMQLHYLLLDNC